MSNLWIKFNRYPPVLVRLLARHPNGDAMSDEELVTDQLTLADIKYLSYLASWDDVPVVLLFRFVTRCGVNFASPTRMKVLNRYLKNARFEHLRRHKMWPEFRSMLAVYVTTLKKK
jgi:hypothetical protein